MITDNERREVARRLRAFSEKLGHISITYLASAIGAEKSDLKSLYDLLADLIEPSIPADPGEAGLASVEGFIRKMRHSTKEEQDEYNAMLEKMSVELHPVDRDALLALADKIERKSNDGTTNPDPMRPLATSLDLFGYARCIRKALGEES